MYFGLHAKCLKSESKENLIERLKYQWINESILSTSNGQILLCYKMSFLGHTSKYEQSFVGLYSHVTLCIESTFNYTFTLGKMSFAFLFMNEDRDGRVVY